MLLPSLHRSFWGNAVKIVLRMSIALLVTLTGCSEPSTPATEVAESEPAPAAPTHNYKIKEGSSYGYVAGLSEDDKNAGKAASEVLMFKYLGKRDDMHPVSMLDDDGTESVKAQCGEPCEIIKMTSSGQVQRIEFTEDSLIGSVLQDAIAGQLEVAGTAKAKS